MSLAAVPGCASFQLPRYNDLVEESERRTAALAAIGPDVPVLNRAASLPGRSQAEIKGKLEPLWQPSRSPLRAANYNGFVATIYSKLQTTPEPMFEPGSSDVAHLGRPVRVEYLAAFHHGKRLPLVVGVSGINGTVDARITIKILQSLYETGDFHVIHLESLTGVKHVVRNGQPFMGGFPESLLLYNTLAELRTGSAHAADIDQVHLLGISFGGLMCGVAGHLEGVYRAGVVDGAILSFSPPLDLKTLFDDLANQRVIREVLRRTYLVDGLERLIRGHASLGMTDEQVAELDFDSYLRSVALPLVQANRPELEAAYPDLPPLETDEDLYAISSVLPFIDRLGVPFFYCFGYDDPVLSPEAHFRRALARCPNRLVDGLLLENGGHLGFDTLRRSPYTARVAEQYFRYWSAGLPAD